MTRPYITYPYLATGGTVARTSPDRWADLINVKDFGAVGNGVIDSTEAIQAAIDALPSSGGEIVFGAGTYMLGAAASGFYAIVLLNRNNITLRGAGKGATTLRVMDDAEVGGIGLTTCTDILIRDLTIDCNRDNQVTDGLHGIRGQDIERLTIDNVRIINTMGYGIGLQDGFLKRIRIVNVDIAFTGADGMDVKNRDDGGNVNEDSMISNVSVRSWGLLANPSSQAAIDLRGPWHLTNICVREPSDNGTGIRFRFGELDDGLNGPGGHQSSLVGFHIDMGSASAGTGISQSGRDVSISDGYIRGGQDGIAIGYRRTKITNVTVEDCADDAFLFGIGSADEAHYSTAVGCHAVNPGDKGFTVSADYVRLIGCSASSGLLGIHVLADTVNCEVQNCTMESNGNFGARVEAGATNTKFLGGALIGNGGGNVISDLGTGTIQTSVT